MPAVDTGGAKTGGPRRKRKPEPAPAAPPRNADTGDTSRSQPAPKPTITRTPFQRPFAAQQAQARTQTRTARNRLPAPVLAAPPIVHDTGGPGRHSGEPMTRAQVNAFLNSQSRITQAARKQIVASVRVNIGDAHGAERVRKLDDLMDEIATNPKLAGTRRAIRYYTALEAKTARPQTTDVAKPGPAPKRVGIGPASINLTSVAAATEEAAARLAPGIAADTDAAQFARNALKDVGAVATAPFVGGYTTGKAALDDFAGALHAIGTGHSPVGALTHGQTAKLTEAMAKGTAHEAAHPVQAFQAHPLLTLLDVAGAASVVGHGLGAVTRAAGSTADAAGVRGALARAGSTVRPPIALSDDPAGGYQQRTYSKDLGRKAVQVIGDKLRDPVTHEDGSVKTVADRGREVPVLASHDRPTVRHPFGERTSMHNAEADFAASRANSVERMVRDEADREMRVRGVKGRKAKDLVAMVVEGTITSHAHFMDDLRRERDRIQGHLDEYEQQLIDGVPKDERLYRHTDELKAARDRLDMVKNALTHPKIGAQSKAIVDAGVEIGRKLNEHERKAVALGILHGGRAKRARLSTTALAHKDARYYREPELQALERAGVPVREPQALAKHQTATQAVKDAGDAVRLHEKELEQLRDQRSRTVGAQAVQRGQEAQQGPVAAFLVGEGEASTATHDLAYRNGLGVKSFMEGDLKNVRSLTIPPDRSHGATGTHRLSPAQVAAIDRRAARHGFERIDHADGSVTWRRSAAQGAQRFATREAAEAHVKQHGGTVRKVSLTFSEAARTGEMARLDRAIANRRRQLSAARKDRHVANRNLRRNPKRPIREALRGPNGRFLSNQEIEDFLTSRGRDPDTVAYLPHKQVGSGFFHQQHRPGARSNMDAGETRTGAAYLKGVTESSAELIRAQGVRQRVQIAKAQALDRMVHDQGMKHPSGSYYTAAEALETADRLFKDTGEVLKPVRAFAAKLDPETRRMIREDLQGPGAMESLGQRLLNDRVITKGITGDKGARNVVLVPGKYIERLERHLRPVGEINKFLQAVNRPFRFAVLATPRWLTGQFVEPYLIRLTASGSGLNVFGLGLDITAATRMLRRAAKSTDPRIRKAAEELVGQQLGGLAIGGRGLSNRVSAEQFGVYGQMVAKLPVVAQAFDMLRILGHVLMKPGGAFFKLNRAIENVAQRAGLGRDVRHDIQAFTGSWIKTLRLQGQALDEVMRGLVDTPTQKRFMASQHELLGKYEGYPPWLRNLIQGPMPFLPWVLNAARFTLWTMPAHHTALTALLIKANDVVAKDWQDIHKNVPPGSLKFAVPTKDGGWIDLARYGPYGLTTPIVGSEGKDLQSITDQFLPQFGGAYAAIVHGEDPFGRPLALDPSENQGQTEPNFGQRVGIGLYGMAESGTPYIGQLRRILEGGSTAYAGSNIIDRDVKPGTKHGRSGLGRTFNPLEPTYLTAGGAGRVISTPSSSSAPSGPPTAAQRRQAMLLRRAARLSKGNVAASRRESMLERRAARLASGR